MPKFLFAVAAALPLGACSQTPPCRRPRRRSTCDGAAPNAPGTCTRHPAVRPCRRSRWPRSSRSWPTTRPRPCHRDADRPHRHRGRKTSTWRCHSAAPTPSGTPCPRRQPAAASLPAARRSQPASPDCRQRGRAAKPQCRHRRRRPGPGGSHRHDRCRVLRSIESHVSGFSHLAS